MKVEITLPGGETVTVDHSQLALRNNAANTGIVLFASLPDGRQLTLAAYDGAFLATSIVPSEPGLLCTPSAEESDHANTSGR